MNENYVCPEHGKVEKFMVDIHGSRIIGRSCPICKKELIKEC